MLYNRVRTCSLIKWLHPYTCNRYAVQKEFFAISIRRHFCGCIICVSIPHPPRALHVKYWCVGVSLSFIFALTALPLKNAKFCILQKYIILKLTYFREYYFLKFLRMRVKSQKCVLVDNCIPHMQLLQERSNKSLSDGLMNNLQEAMHVDLYFLS